MGLLEKFAGTYFVASLTALTGTGLTVLVFYFSTINNFPKYHFDGHIGENRVVFWEKPWTNHSVLNVIKPNGNQEAYVLAERGGRLYLESVVTETAGQVKSLAENSGDPDVLAKLKRAKADSEEYIKSIVKAKARQ